ncbi:MAG: sulfatase-like hydrolase/transferase [Candidatus Woesearchaeota archaeon]
MENKNKMPQNIVLIVVDCLRADCAYDKNLMPFTNKIFRYKKEAYTNAPSTHFAMPAILTGKLPFEVTNKEGINEDNIEFYLPKIMKEKGYKTIFITANAVTSRYFGYNQYCDYFEDFIVKTTSKTINNKIFNVLKVLIPYKIRKSKNKILFFLRERVVRLKEDIIRDKIRDKQIVNILKKIKFSNKNFIILHFMGPHTPYCPENINNKKVIKKVRELTDKLYLGFKLKNEEIKFLKNMYVEEVKQVDKNIKNIHNFLCDKLKSNFLFIVTADHGEAFNETGYLAHPRTEIDNIFHLSIPFFSNKKIKKKIIFTTDIYQIIKGKQKQREERPFCISYKKNKNNLYSPLYARDYTTNRIIKNIRKTNKLILKIKRENFFNSEEMHIKDAIKYIKVPNFKVSK